MEPNDNGPRPEGYDPQYQYMKRYRRRRKIICLVLVLLLPAIFVAFFSIASFGPANHTIILAETTFMTEVPRLAIIEHTGITGDMVLATDDVRKLDARIINGSFIIVTHDEDVVRLRSSGQVSSYFDADQGLLSLQEQNSSGAFIIIYIPHGYREVVFEQVVIEGVNGSIVVNGDDGFFAEDVHIVNQNGSLVLKNITVYGQLEINNLNGVIILNDVIADAEQLSISNQNGWINVN